MVLKGEYKDDKVDSISAMLLSNLKQALLEEENNKFITEEQFKGKVKAWRESTSTSPGSGRHLGHYMVLYTAPPNGMEHKEKEEWRQKKIIQCYLLIINYCVKYRYVLERWKQVTNMMIYKEKGNIKLHWLCTIHLYGADLALFWVEHWCCAIHRAVKHRTLHHGQYGGLLSRECSSVCFLEELQFDFQSLLDTQLQTLTTMQNCVTTEFSQMWQVCAIKNKVSIETWSLFIQKH